MTGAGPHMQDAGKVIYLGYYDTDRNPAERRNVVRSATTKMDYVAKALEAVGYAVDIVSMAGTKLESPVPSHVVDRGGGGKLVLFSDIGVGRLPKYVVSRLLMRGKMRRYLRALPEGSLVMAYHALGYAGLLRRERRRSGFKLVLEVEEFYSDVLGSPLVGLLERRLFGSCDGFLCSTELLAERLSRYGRPSAVCSGVYSMAPKVAGTARDDKVHVVYAGTLDPRKGALAAVRAGALLGPEFRMHILGSGSDSELELLRKVIEDCGEGSSGCVVTYDGYKSGDEFAGFVQGCHIGLSPQDADAGFNETSFPSKVFMYLSNGLQVVSVDLPVFRDGRLREVLYLSLSNEPRDLADAIERCRRSAARPAGEVMAELNDRFEGDLERLLGEVRRG